jgi:GNAT superfamily N-acetyltransferase
MNPYPIRACSQDDSDTLSETIREAFLDVAERFGLNCHNSPRHPSNCRTDWILRDMNRGVVYYILEKDGQSAGCVAVEKISDETCYLERLAVIPSQRHHGYGEALVFHALAQAKDMGVRRVEIGIIAEDHALKNWYEKMGFIEKAGRDFSHMIFRVTFLFYDFDLCRPCPGPES